MKPKLAPRHIIPVVCYVLLFIGFVFLAVVGFAVDFTNSKWPNLEGTGMFGLLMLGLVVALKLVLILIGVGGALLSLFPLVFSSINIAKRGRPLAIACLVFDALWCQSTLGGLLATLFDFESIAPILVSLLVLIPCALALSMNILNIKKNGPPAIEDEPTEPDPIPEPIEGDPA